MSDSPHRPNSVDVSGQERLEPRLADVTHANIGSQVNAAADAVRVSHADETAALNTDDSSASTVGVSAARNTDVAALNSDDAAELNVGDSAAVKTAGTVALSADDAAAALIAGDSAAVNTSVAIADISFGAEFHRSGFVAVVGRPNVGKSTLLNAMVGQPITTTSAKPQTTRRAIRGIITRADAQLVLVDTPGVHRPRTLLGERLNEVVYRAWSEVDVVAVCLPANEDIGTGDEFILQRLQQSRSPLIAVVTKSDTISKEQLAAKLLSIAELESRLDVNWELIIPVSAKSGTQIDDLVTVLCNALPQGPVLYPDGLATDDDIDSAIADIVREAALERLSDELPHSVATVVEEIVLRDESNPDGALEVRVSLFVERDSQKGIVIGRSGAMLRDIGAAARPRVAQVLGRSIHLALHVRVAKEWQRDPAQLRKLGFDHPR